MLKALMEMHNMNEITIPIIINPNGDFKNDLSIYYLKKESTNSNLLNT